MATKIQGNHLDENRAKVTKKLAKKFEAKYGVVEGSQNQNGVVFSNLKHVARNPLMKSSITHVSILYNYSDPCFSYKKLTLSLIKI